LEATVLHAFGKPLTIEEVRIATTGPGEMLIKVMANGVCHTDLYATDGSPGEFQTPILDVVMNRIRIHRSIVGGRANLAEATEGVSRD
jgi:NADPH:quinone reductase-like Zn-dependent oxidoreductase